MQPKQEEILSFDIGQMVIAPHGEGQITTINPSEGKALVSFGPDLGNVTYWFLLNELKPAPLKFLAGKSYILHDGREAVIDDLTSRDTYLVSVAGLQSEMSAEEIKALIDAPLPDEPAPQTPPSNSSGVDTSPPSNSPQFLGGELDGTGSEKEDYVTVEQFAEKQREVDVLKGQIAQLTNQILAIPTYSAIESKTIIQNLLADNGHPRIDKVDTEYDQLINAGWRENHHNIQMVVDGNGILRMTRVIHLIRYKPADLLVPNDESLPPLETDELAPTIQLSPDTHKVDRQKPAAEVPPTPPEDDDEDEDDGPPPAAGKAIEREQVLPQLLIEGLPPQSPHSVGGGFSEVLRDGTMSPDEKKRAGDELVMRKIEQRFRRAM